MKKVILLLIVFLQLSYSQPMKYPQHDSLILGMERKNLLKYSLVAYSFSTFYIEYRWWWKGNYQKFGYKNDGVFNNYSLGVDKAGHFFTHYFYFQALFELMEWGGFDETTTLYSSIAIPAIYGLSIEINDGFTFYAFSGYDLTANVLGIGYGVLQRFYPVLNNFKFKFSYYPSGNIPINVNFIPSSDYDGHMYWLSTNVHGILPGQLKNYWPKFLNISLGYGAINIYSTRPWFGGISATGTPTRKFAVSLDYNLGSISTHDDFLYTLRNIVDYFHFPAPGIKQIQGQSPTFKPLLVN